MSFSPDSYLRSVACIAAIGFVVADCSRATAQEVVSNIDKNGRTIISDIPWTPTPAPAQEKTADGSEKVVYGADNRIDVYQETDAGRLALAASTCGLLDATDLTYNSGNDTYTISTSAYTVSGKPACSGEPFAAQPTAMFCTGFLVGSDIIATAGHCYSSSDISDVRFVFGFTMLNASTPVTVVPAANVYSGVEILGRQLAGELDYAVIRIDRPVTAAGAAPLQIRRSGTIALNTPVGVIGHPAGLPLKIAYGATTAVHGNSASGYFTANLDTYGGNSGSPVFNQQTGVVEGILVRGAADYVVGATCFTSNFLPDSPGQEDVSRTTTFNSFVRSLAYFDKTAYSCGANVGIRVVDRNHGAGSLAVTVTTSAGDSETVTATGPQYYIYSASVPATASSIVTPGNGILETSVNGTVTVSYTDPSYLGFPETYTSTVGHDCQPPTASGFQVTNATPTSFVLNFTADEPVTSTITACDGSYTVNWNSLSEFQSILLYNLTACTTYQYTVTIADEAGNTRVHTNNGNCFGYTTPSAGPIVLDDDFEPAAVAGWTHSAATGADNWAERVDAVAMSPTHVYSYTPGSSVVADARLVSPPIPACSYLEFYHQYNFETGWDGGIIELSTDNGASWSSLSSRITSGGYNTTIATGGSNPIGGQQAWSGSNGAGMTKVQVDTSGLPANFRIRFRFTSDSSVASGGWRIDDVRAHTIVLCGANADAQWLTVE